MNLPCLVITSQRWLLLVVLAAVSFVTSRPVPVWAANLRRSPTVQAVERARPSVVNIHGKKTVRSNEYSADKTKRVNGMGTGIVVDRRGYILTNYHVVEGVRRVRVTLHDGQAYIARLVAHDPATDLAIIKIPTKFHMPVISVGNSQDIMTGETVIAMGNAYGYEHTVTTGIVSAQHRNVAVNDSQFYRDLIQTDASINPGNSGGPLLNIDGQMIGINVAVRVGAQGIGFAIPANQGMQVAARLLSVERLSGLWHGVIHEDTFVDKQSRVVVRDVQDGSPAYKAGIREGDVILQVAGKKIGRGLDVECALIGTQSGDSVKLAIAREEKKVDVSINLVDHPKHAPKKTFRPTKVDDVSWDTLGIRLQALSTAETKRESGKFRGGLRVVAIKSDGMAAGQGIRKDDILVGIHVWETVSPENLTYILKETDFGQEKSVLFYILRAGKTLAGNFTVASFR